MRAAHPEQRQQRGGGGGHVAPGLSRLSPPPPSPSLPAHARWGGVAAAVSAAGAGGALWGEHGSLPRGGGRLLGAALADEAARRALLRQGNGGGDRAGPASAPLRSPEGFLESAQLSARRLPSAPPLTPPLSPVTGVGCAPSAPPGCCWGGVGDKKEFSPGFVAVCALRAGQRGLGWCWEEKFGAVRSWGCVVWGGGG